MKFFLLALTLLLSLGLPLAASGESIVLSDRPIDEVAGLSSTVTERLKDAKPFSLTVRVTGTKRDEFIQSEVMTQLKRNFRTDQIPLHSDPTDTSGDNPYIAVFLRYIENGKFRQFHFSFNVRVAVDNPFGGPRLSALLSRNVSFGVVVDPADLEEATNEFLTDSVRKFGHCWHQANMPNNFPLPE